MFNESEKRLLLEIAFISVLHNTEDDVFWYKDADLSVPYNQDTATVGDHFWDGNNGDEHIVVAISLENRRLLFKNIDQRKDIDPELAIWLKPFKK